MYNLIYIFIYLIIYIEKPSKISNFGENKTQQKKVGKEGKKGGMNGGRREKEKNIYLKPM